MPRQACAAGGAGRGRSEPRPAASLLFAPIPSSARRDAASNTQSTAGDHHDGADAPLRHWPRCHHATNSALRRRSSQGGIARLRYLAVIAALWAPSAADPILGSRRPPVVSPCGARRDAARGRPSIIRPRLVLSSLAPDLRCRRRSPHAPTCSPGCASTSVAPLWGRSLVPTPRRSPPPRACVVGRDVRRPRHQLAPLLVSLAGAGANERQHGLGLSLRCNRVIVPHQRRKLGRL